MKILQLCCFTNHWGNDFEVENWDLKNGKDVLKLQSGYIEKFDFVLFAPPCTQFTKANNSNWIEYPKYDLDLVNHVLNLIEKSKVNFVIENPPGRLEKLVPGLKKYRRITLNDIESNKEWVLYSNLLLLNLGIKRYGRKSVTNKSPGKRLEYNKFFINYLKKHVL